MYIICMIGLVFFAMIGLCAFILSLIRILTESKDENEYFVILPNLNAQNAEGSIRSAKRKINDIGKGNILCLCDKGDTEAEDICQRLAADCPYLRIVDKTKLCRELKL